MMKNKSMRLAVGLILMLFMAQIFTPFVVAQAQSEDNDTAAMAGNLTLPANVSENTALNTLYGVIKSNRITFVLGTDEHLLSLFNASIGAAVNATIEVMIYNATEAKSADFSNESVVFLASLDNATVASINETINESAYVFAYNLTTNVSIGTVDDVNITKYWVYGGDENVRNLITYMDNKFYGNKTEVDPPKAPKKPKIIFLVTGHGIPLEIIYEASKEVKDMINVSAYRCMSPYSPAKPILPDDINLSIYDVVVVCGWVYDIHGMPDFPSRLDAAKEHTNVIVMDPFAIPPGNVNLSAHPDIHKYWDYGVKENAKRLITYLGVNFCGLNAVVEPPLSFPDPDRAIYHPDSPLIFENLTKYLEWYGTDDGTHHVYDPENITIGIIFGRYAKKREDTKPQDHLIRTIEGRECNVIPIYGSSRQYNVDEFFIKDSKPIVDVIISTDVLPNFVNERENFKSSNVPVLYGTGAPYRGPTEWEDTREGITPRLIQYAALSEIDGLIEPTVFYARIIDNETTGTKHHEPIDYQIDYITNRAISWAKLRYMNNSNKKVVITHKNDEVGKAGLGTDMEMYLDVPASIEKILYQMQERGYNVGSAPLPNVSNITKLMVEKGRNVGEWAPEALDTLVETGDPILIPENRYLEWFKELPGNRQEEVIKYWGEPPGDIMVWQNDTGKYIVIPKFQFGNVLIAPHPMRPDVPWQLYQLDNKFPSYQGELPPYHQYIAWYMAMKNEFGADGLVTLGESPFPGLAGKQFGLGRYDWNGLLLQDMPNLCSWPLHYNAETHKRRGGFVMVSYLSPTLVPSGLHGDLSNLQQKIRLYNQASDGTLKEGYKKTIIIESGNLSLDSALNVNLSAMDNTTTFESFVKRLDDYLNEIKVSYMPYGMHILSEPPTNESLVAMVESMFGESFKDNVSVINSSEGVITKLLTEVLLNGLGPEDAQNKVLGQVSDNITSDLILAVQYKNLVNESTEEIERTLDALEGQYIHPGMYGDLVDHPDLLPTGKNVYSFDGRLIPTKEAWNIGVEMAKQQLQLHANNHNGCYPRKIGVVLWKSETCRLHGVVESEILYFLGVKPVWESHDRWKDVELIPSGELGRPRIDVVMTTSGSYRDMFGYKFELLEKAVRLAANASDTEYPNYVKENSDFLYQWLRDEKGYNDTEARSLSAVRIFTHDIGKFGTGLHEAIPASNMWDNESEVADVYISATSYMYGADVWGVQSRDIFEQNLDGIEIGIFSCSSEVVGVLDQGVDSYLGGLALAVRSVSGETPDLYITHLRDQNNPTVETLSHFFNRELMTRYFNPKWMEGMMEHDYTGAKNMEEFMERFWRWDVEVPDLITEDMWNQVYDVYIQDKYDLGLNEFFDSNNPYAQQSITARMLETIRKGYWDPAETYQKSVDEYGVTCCHHTCGNLLLQDYMQGIVSASALEQSTEQSSYSSGGGGGSWSRRSTETETETEEETVAEPDKGVINATETTGVSKLGEELKKPPEKTADEKRGKVMKEEKLAEEASPAFPISSAPLMGIIAVIVALVLIGIGLGYKRRKK
jgi:cobaltochelatase CobN